MNRNKKYFSRLINITNNIPNLDIPYKIICSDEINGVERMVLGCIFTTNLNNKPFHLNDEQIASLLNLSRKTINRCFKDLRNKHFIYLAHKDSKRYVMLNINKIFNSKEISQIKNMSQDNKINKDTERDDVNVN